RKLREWRCGTTMSWLALRVLLRRYVDATCSSAYEPHHNWLFIDYSSGEVMRVCEVGSLMKSFFPS
ncbi:MAG: hypothetical protein J0H57_04330, partial [Rhodospirillales bacterium]|nr:hypothetical protein [Rhodospirillales bacterium]